MNHKPKFALICDARNWAFDNIAQQLARHFAPDYNVKIFYTQEFDIPFQCFVEVFCSFKPQRMHVFPREHFFEIYRNPNRTRKLLQADHIPTDQFGQKLAETAISVSVHDHLNSTSQKLVKRQGLYQLIDAYSVCSPVLDKIYRNTLHAKPQCVTADGVDLDLFDRKQAYLAGDSSQSLVVGWVGNSAWGQGVEDDNKGFHSVVLPAIAALQQQGVAVKGFFADRVDRWRNQQEMVEYYNEIDVLVCASKHEGTPDPILEALACSVPVITTDVGIVGSLAIDQNAGVVLPERSIDALQAALTDLALDRSMLNKFSSNARACVYGSRWLAQMPSWTQLDKAAMHQHKLVGAAKRMLMSRYF